VNGREAVKAQADRVVGMTVEDARALPGMLGKIVPLQLELHGWYARTSDGVVTFYEREDVATKLLEGNARIEREISALVTRLGGTA
jgi:hypothetical protein